MGFSDFFFVCGAHNFLWLYPPNMYCDKSSLCHCLKGWSGPDFMRNKHTDDAGVCCIHLKARVRGQWPHPLKVVSR